jgi:hypothetical protein
MAEPEPVLSAVPVEIPLGIFVRTPISEKTYGITQGNYDGSILVRIPITPETQLHLLDLNCLTKHATLTGLWFFPLKDLKPLEEKRRNGKNSNSQTK